MQHPYFCAACFHPHCNYVNVDTNNQLELKAAMKGRCTFLLAGGLAECPLIPKGTLKQHLFGCYNAFHKCLGQPPVDGL